MRARGDVALMAEFSRSTRICTRRVSCTGWTSTDTQAETVDAGLATDGGLPARCVHASRSAGSRLPARVIWLRDEHAGLTALREEITQKSATMQRLAHGRDADFTARRESPPTGRHQAG